MGHAGTLDPLATGLLIVATGVKTRELTHIIGQPKTYVAHVLLGVSTDTGDVTGKVLSTSDASHITTLDIQKVLKGMLGELEIPAPIFSAIKKKGVPLYKYARKGESVTPPLRRMTVRRATLRTFDTPIAEIEFAVESGTYIRSVAVELGKRLGVDAALQDLRRISIGGFVVDDAISIN